MNLIPQGNVMVKMLSIRLLDCDDNADDCSSMDDEQYCVRTVPSYWKSRSMQVVNQLVYQMLNKYFNKKFYLDNCLVNCADESDESLRDG
ncbi:unnamed protein product [Rotaria sp. Silwood2]|nr:unnamed protein product [Rotaria sp. Silwood2]